MIFPPLFERYVHKNNMFVLYCLILSPSDCGVFQFSPAGGGGKPGKTCLREDGCQLILKHALIVTQRVYTPREGNQPANLAERSVVQSTQKRVIQPLA